jgi:hypothetical protein
MRCSELSLSLVDSPRVCVPRCNSVARADSSNAWPAVTPLCGRLARHLRRRARWKYDRLACKAKSARAWLPRRPSQQPGALRALEVPHRHILTPDGASRMIESGSCADLWEPAGEIPASYSAETWPTAGKFVPAIGESLRAIDSRLRRRGRTSRRHEFRSTTAALSRGCKVAISRIRLSFGNPVLSA